MVFFIHVRTVISIDNMAQRDVGYCAGSTRAVLVRKALAMLLSEFTMCL